jgi:hypothetical protein
LLDRLCESLVRLEKRKEVAWEMGGVGPMIMVDGNVAAEKVDRNGNDEVEKPPD